MHTSFLSESADGAGRVLSRLTAGLAALRPAAKPLHPDGELFSAQLVRAGSPLGSRAGVAWLDDAGSDEVLVRVSAAIGLPSPLPDISGLALRVPGPGRRPADILFASTGWDPVTRHLLVPALRAGQPLTTLLPYRTCGGPLVLGARPDGDACFELSWAYVGRGWHRFATLTLAESLVDDTGIAFDPVLHQVAGLAQYPWVARIRERSYATARASRTR